MIMTLINITIDIALSLRMHENVAENAEDIKSIMIGGTPLIVVCMVIGLFDIKTHLWKLVSKLHPGTRRSLRLMEHLSMTRTRI